MDNEPSNRQLFDAILGVGDGVREMRLEFQEFKGAIRRLQGAQTLNTANTANTTNSFTTYENPPMPHHPTLPIAPVYTYDPSADLPGAPDNAPPYMMPYDRENDLFFDAPDLEAEQRM
jgi:hypothetical protein